MVNQGYGFRKSVPKWSWARLNEVRDLVRDGVSVKSIALKFGVPVQTLYAAMNRSGLSVKDYKVTQKTMFKEKDSEDDLATRLRFLKGESVEKPESKAFFLIGSLKDGLVGFRRLNELILGLVFLFKKSTIL